MMNISIFRAVFVVALLAVANAKQPESLLEQARQLEESISALNSGATLKGAGIAGLAYTNQVATWYAIACIDNIMNDKLYSLSDNVENYEKWLRIPVDNERVSVESESQSLDENYQSHQKIRRGLDSFLAELKRKVEQAEKVEADESNNYDRKYVLKTNWLSSHDTKHERFEKVYKKALSGYGVNDAYEEDNVIYKFSFKPYNPDSCYGATKLSFWCDHKMVKNTVQPADIWDLDDYKVE